MADLGFAKTSLFGRVSLNFWWKAQWQHLLQPLSQSPRTKWVNSLTQNQATGGAVPFLETDICQLSISSRKRSGLELDPLVMREGFWPRSNLATLKRVEFHKQTNKQRQIRDLKQASSFDFWCNDSRWTLNLLPPLSFVSHIGDHCHGKTDRWSGFWAESFDQKMIDKNSEQIDLPTDVFASQSESHSTPTNKTKKLGKNAENISNHLETSLLTLCLAQVFKSVFSFSLHWVHGIASYITSKPGCVDGPFAARRSCRKNTEQLQQFCGRSFLLEKICGWKWWKDRLFPEEFTVLLLYHEAWARVFYRKDCKRHCNQEAPWHLKQRRRNYQKDNLVRNVTNKNSFGQTSSCQGLGKHLVVREPNLAPKFLANIQCITKSWEPAAWLSDFLKRDKLSQIVAVAP